LGRCRLACRDVQGPARDPIEVRPREGVDLDEPLLDATLAAPAVGSGGGYYEGAPHERFAAVPDGVRSGITPVGWGCSASVLVLMSGVALGLQRSHDHLASAAKFAMVAPMFFARLHRCHRRRPSIDRGAVRDHAAGGVACHLAIPGRHLLGSLVARNRVAPPPRSSPPHPPPRSPG
jgi:hypothetical protein